MIEINLDEYYNTTSDEHKPMPLVGPCGYCPTVDCRLTRLENAMWTLIEAHAKHQQGLGYMKEHEKMIEIMSSPC